MRQFLLLALGLASLCSAQTSSFGALPGCARPCAATLPINCNTDVKCICADKAFIRDISCCVAKACSANEVQKTLQVAQQLCSTVKVQLPNGLPPECAGPGGAAAAAGGSSSSAATPATSAAGGSSSAGSTATGTATSATGATTTEPEVFPATGAASCMYAGDNIAIIGAGLFAAALL